MSSNIDPTKPGTGVAYTADVRANFLAAKNEIEALQSGKQVADDTLNALAALNAVANTIAYFTSPNSAALAPTTTAGLKLLGTTTNATRVAHTWTVTGAVRVASGDTDYIIPMFAPVPAGRYGLAVQARSRINSGTSVTLNITKNGVTVVAGLIVTPTATLHDFTDFSLADGDLLGIVVTAVNGSPQNMTFSLFVDYGVS